MDTHLSKNDLKHDTWKFSNFIVTHQSYTAANKVIILTLSSPNLYPVLDLSRLAGGHDGKHQQANHCNIRQCHWNGHLVAVFLETIADFKPTCVSVTVTCYHSDRRPCRQTGKNKRHHHLQCPKTAPDYEKKKKTKQRDISHIYIKTNIIYQIV